MPINTTTGIPPDPAPDVRMVEYGGEFNEELRGFVGKKLHSHKESIKLFGIVDHLINGEPTRLMSVNIELINIGDADFNLGPNRGETAKYYDKGVNFPTGLSSELLDCWIETDLQTRVASLLSPVTLHWSAWYPLGGQQGSKWRWNNYVLEFQTGAVPIGDPIVAGNVINLGNSFGMDHTEDVTFVATLKLPDQPQQRIEIPMKIGRAQAEIDWDKYLTVASE